MRETVARRMGGEHHVTVMCARGSLQGRDLARSVKSSDISEGDPRHLHLLLSYAEKVIKV